MGNSLWERSLALGAPPTILGAPYVEAIDMDPVGAGTYPILFGDFRRAYIIVDRVSMVVKRLNELGAKIGIIEFMVRKRVGGQVILPQALRKMKISVS
jgi:HK97 family phage major capsid protein